MMALTLSVGCVVDGAIVMLENIARHMEKGEPPLAAALDGAREVGFTILSMTLSLAAVFIPVLFMGGIVGRLFHEFAVTIGAAILVSGLVSLTLTPMLCSRFLRPSREAHHGKLYEQSERVYQRVLGWYERSLDWVMNRRPAAMAFSAAILLGTGVLFVAVPKGFLPSEDNSQIFGTTETVEGTSFDDLVSHQLQVMAVLQQDPNVVGTMSFLGGGGTINQGRVFMQLKPRSQRRVSVDDLIRYFNGKLAGIPGIQVFLQNPPPIQIGGRRTKSLYQFTLQSPDRVGLYDNATRLAAQLRKLPDLLNVTSDVQISNPQATVTISFDLRQGVSIGTAVTQVQRVAQQSLPSSITTSFAGTAQAFQSSQAGLLLLLILSVLVIYMVLGILYESFIHPLTILSALPFAAFGALLTLLIFRVDLSVYAFVGVIMLVGLVKKNGIMMIDFALEAQRTEGKSPRDAILQACRSEEHTSELQSRPHIV